MMLTAMVLVALPSVSIAASPPQGQMVLSDAIVMVYDPEDNVTYEADAIPSGIDRGQGKIAWTPGNKYAYADVRAITPIETGGGTYQFILDAVQWGDRNSIKGYWKVLKNGVPVSANLLQGTAAQLGSGVGSNFIISITEPGVGIWKIEATITFMDFGYITPPLGVEGLVRLNDMPLTGVSVKANMRTGSPLVETTYDGRYEFPLVKNLSDVAAIALVINNLQGDDAVVSGKIRFECNPVAGAAVLVYRVSPLGQTLLQTLETDGNGFFKTIALDAAGSRIRVVIRPTAP